MKDLRQFIQITDGLAEPLRRGFLSSIDDYEKRLVKMTKEETTAFVKKYLEEKRYEALEIPDDSGRAWEIAVEYIIEDIIPYLYGEALD